MIEEFHNIPIFSTLWWISNVSLTIIISSGLYFAKKSTEKTQKKIEYAMLGFLLVIVLGWQIHYLKFDNWDVATSLPLHLCSITRIVAVILLFKFSQILFEFCALIGLGGVLQSLLTPAISAEYNWITHTEYFVSHGFIFFTVFYLFYVKGHKLRNSSWWKAYIFGNVVMLIIGIINYLVGANYWYICIKPGADNALLIGPWPYYISGFLLFGLINSLVFFGIFKLWDRWLLNPVKEV